MPKWCHFTTTILIDWLIDWFVFNVQRAIFQLYSGREHFKYLSATGLETRKGDGYGRIILPVQQVSYGPLIMSIMLIMNCNTGFFNVRRGWQSLNTGPQFYLRLICRTGWLWISTSHTTDGRPFKPKKLSVPFLYPGVPAGLVSFGLWKKVDND